MINHSRTTGSMLAVVSIGVLLASTTAAAAPMKAGGTKIGLRHSTHGMVLDGTSRKYVYVHVTPKGKNAGCNVVCQSIWPRVTTSGKPQAGSGVKASKLGRTSSGQVTYDGYLLFYYSPAPQAPSGDGANSFGGEWELITASGSLK